MPEQRHDLGEAQFALARPLDQREQRSEFLLRPYQRIEAGAEEVIPAANAERRLSANPVCATALGYLSAAHTGTTWPELSNCTE